MALVYLLHILLLYTVILGAFLSLVGAQTGCDYRQNLVAGRFYDIFSPGFPNRYRGAQNCRWTAVAPAGMTVLIECTTMELPRVCNFL